MYKTNDTKFVTNYIFFICIIRFLILALFDHDRSSDTIIFDNSEVDFDRCLEISKNGLCEFSVIFF